ncbi:kinase-like domain-containing protein [Radiomyces spectabilis]|uniref:kinase-like domain-containing protein n=1 Tax=Radiomyces spectabilis TaxID=64574 RepID=UPI00221F9613|nr:kinase-like domain-containing protein [Radiomyces spectabilis]KAI8388541.1 kinase-like domain-containing protein [Radiomyces spectabilis]
MPTLNITDIGSPSPQRRIIGKSSRPPHPTSPGRRRKEIGNYWLGRTLGKGSSGSVKLGIHKVSGEKVAVKIIPRTYLASNTSVERAVKREIAIMKLIDHPYIMRLLDVIDLASSSNLYLILEYVQGGELFQHLVSRGKLSESEARRHFQQIIFGLDFCHRHRICHRDLKPENLLLDEKNNIKIADFGMASLQPVGSLLATSCGSPHYASPEIVTGIPYNGAASDIWSCGIILYALLCGHLPFDDEDIRELLNKVKAGKYKMPSTVSSQARDLIERILVVDPAKRLTMKDVQEHPWFTSDPLPDVSLLPSPPTAEEIGRPVASVNDIDDRLLDTLKVLWTEWTSEAIIDSLLNEEHNMHKVTYVLLQRHANNYWQTERDDEIRSLTSPAKRRRPATICGVASGKDSLPSIDGMMLHLAEKERKTPRVMQQVSEIQCSSQANLRDCHQRDQNASTETDDPMDGLSAIPPPPLPPKPRVIRADLGHHDLTVQAGVDHWWINQVQCAYGSSQPPIDRDHRGYRVYPTTALQRPVCTAGHPLSCIHTPHISDHFRRTLQQHACTQPPNQRPIASLLSPRASLPHHFHVHNSTDMHYSHPRTEHNRYLAGLCSPDLRLSGHTERNRFSRFTQLWQRYHHNRVDPTIKSRQALHRLSMPIPSPNLDFDRNPVSAVSQWAQTPSPQARREFTVLSKESRALRMFGGSLATNERQYYYSTASNSGEERAVDNSHLNSWLPGLFHFKQPKVCSIDCYAKDEREAVGKIAQVLEECMQGHIVEQYDANGYLKRKGQMTLPGMDHALLKFKLEVVRAPYTDNNQRQVMRVNFTQQQGEAMALVAAVKMVETALNTYQKEADLIAAANGWA